MQRCFAFYAFTPPPIDASTGTIAECASERDAIEASLIACRDLRMPDGRLRLQCVFAGLIGKSKSYVSRVKKGELRLPEWMVAPFCRFTGTNLLHQYRELQRQIKGVSTDNLRRQRIARQLQQRLIDQDHDAAVERRLADRRAA